MQGKEILRLVSSLHRNKEIDEDVIFQAIEAALQSAAHKHFGIDADVSVAIDRETGDVAALCGDQRIEPEMLGRIAAQTAKQVIVQKVRDAERKRQYEEYKDRIGEIVNGLVKRIEFGNVVVDLFTRGLGVRPRAWLDRLHALILAAIAALFTWRLALGGVELRSAGETSMILGVPIWWGFAPIVASSALLAAVALHMAISGDGRSRP